MDDRLVGISLVNLGARRKACIAGILAAMAAAALAGSGHGLAAVENCYDVWPGDTNTWGEWYDSSGARLTYIPCELYEPASGELSAEFGVDIRIYLPGEMRDSAFPDRVIPGWLEAPHPDATPNTPELIVEATRTTLAALRPHLDPIDISIVLLQSVSGQRIDGDWNWDTAADADGGEPCPISLYLTDVVEVRESGNRPADPQDVKSSIAHEIYHCFQKKYFRSQERAASSADDGWWVEGTAEFLASQLFPCGPSSAGIARDYVTSTRLNRQGFGGYSVYIFYTDLADKHGFDIPALIDFTRRMPTVAGADAQDAALADYPGAANKFHTFAQDFADGEISHCVSGNLNYGSVESIIVSDGTEVPLDIAPFRFEPKKVVLERGKEYEVRLAVTSGGSDRRTTSYRRADEWGPGSWTTMHAKTKIMAECDKDNTYVIVSTVEGEGNTVSEAKLIFEETDSPLNSTPEFGCCVDTGQHDRCLVGTWVRDNEFMLQQLEAKLNITDPTVISRITEFTGELRATFRADGTSTGFGHQYTSAWIKIPLPPTGGTHVTTVDHSMTTGGTARWSTSGNSVLHACPQSDRSHDVAKVTNPDSLKSPLAELRTPNGIDFQYTCRGNVLELELPGGVGMKQRFLRAGNQ